jgi:hypothetical protein
MDGLILKLVIKHCCGQYEQNLSNNDGDVERKEAA